MCAVGYFVNNPNSQNNEITDSILVNFGIRNPQIIKPAVQMIEDYAEKNMANAIKYHLTLK